MVAWNSNLEVTAMLHNSDNSIAIYNTNTHETWYLHSFYSKQGTCPQIILELLYYYSADSDCPQPYISIILWGEWLNIKPTLYRHDRTHSYTYCITRVLVFLGSRHKTVILRHIGKCQQCRHIYKFLDYWYYYYYTESAEEFGSDHAHKL
jgi:hypothetical protein